MRRTRTRDFTRDCELVEEQVGLTLYSYLAMREPPRILASDQDIEYTVVAGDRIDNLAVRFYQDRYLWWVLADANGLTDPSVDLYPGMVLVVPNPRYVKERLVP